MKPRTALVLFGVLFIAGCVASLTPAPVTNFLSGGDRTIAGALEEAAADWARHGLEIANFVTVDDVGAGLPVRFATDAELTAAGVSDETIGVTRSKDGKWVDLLIYDELVRDPDKLLHIVRHELIHALVPRATHLEGADGTFTRQRTVQHITRADMEHLANFTEVTPSQVPFAGEPA